LVSTTIIHGKGNGALIVKPAEGADVGCGERSEPHQTRRAEAMRFVPHRILRRCSVAHGRRYDQGRKRSWWQRLTLSGAALTPWPLVFGQPPCSHCHQWLTTLGFGKAERRHRCRLLGLWEDDLYGKGSSEGGFAWSGYAQWTPKLPGLGSARYAIMYDELPAARHQPALLRSGRQ